MINCGLILSSISEEGGGGECQDSIVTNIKISILISYDCYFLYKILILLFIKTLKLSYFLLFILSIFCINFVKFQFAE